MRAARTDRGVSCYESERTFIYVEPRFRKVCRNAVIASFLDYRHFIRKEGYKRYLSLEGVPILLNTFQYKNRDDEAIFCEYWYEIASLPLVTRKDNPLNNDFQGYFLVFRIYVE